MRRVFLWIIASGAVMTLCTGFVVVAIGSIGIGFIGALQECGIELVTGQTARQPASSPTPSPTGTATTTPAPSESTSVVALGAAGEAYFDQFSASQQAEMKKNAALIVTIGANRPEKLTRHDIEATVGVAMQESHITNLLVATDHDSLGIFQQRPSVGSWGTPEQIVDPVHATNRFYDQLVNIPADQRQNMALIDIGIAVQNPSKEAYHRTWKWDGAAKDIVALYMSGGSDDVAGSICSESAGVSTGAWQLPLASNSYCTLDAFGMRWHPIDAVWRLHSGVDLACNDGDPIYAVHDGTITMAGPNGDLGNYVKIDHGDDVSTGYGHMVRIAEGISKGVHVSAGQVIGYVGTTGGSTGPHLHFMVVIKGEPTDPVTYMEKVGVLIK